MDATAPTNETRDGAAWRRATLHVQGVRGPGGRKPRGTPRADPGPFALGYRAQAFVDKLVGHPSPTPEQVVRAWTPNRAVRSDPRLPGLEIEAWLAHHHAGFRTTLELSARARNVLYAALERGDFTPGDVVGHGLERVGQMYLCGPGTLREIAGWAARHGAAPPAEPAPRRPIRMPER